MDALTRRTKIEALLAEWFRKEGWDVIPDNGIAIRWRPWGDAGELRGDGEVFLGELADYLEREIEGALK